MENIEIAVWDPSWKMPWHQYELEKLLPGVNKLMTDLYKSSDPANASALPPRQVALDDLLRIVQQPAVFIVVAVDRTYPDEPVLVGMATAFVNEKFSGLRVYVEDVVVDESLRGKKLGRRVMEKLLKVASDKNVLQAKLTSGNHRVAAHALYLKLGFEGCDTTVFKKKM